ncbi:MAG: hypothetical protein IJ190_12440 [Prevotella sp.]|nr:hypothetical protein [Prevotella sp.]
MEQKEKKKKEADFFYHYIMQETLCCMLNDYRENIEQGNLIFWASSIFTMNDPQVMRHGMDVFKVLVPFNENFYKKVFDIIPGEKLNVDTFDYENSLLD